MCFAEFKFIYYEDYNITTIVKLSVTTGAIKELTSVNETFEISTFIL